MRLLIRRGSGEAGKRVSLEDDEIHHIKVRRARDGDRVEVRDGAGLVAAGILVKADREWMVEITAAEVREPPPALILGVASGDRDRFSWMVEKAAEMGVTQVVPLETERTASVATRLKDTHIPRLRRSAMETLKQCGASWATAVEEPVPLSTFVKEPVSGNRWLAHQSGAPAPPSLDHTPITVIVGPEGGLTEREVKSVTSAGYQPISVGTHTLRFETAALASAAAVTQARLRGRHG
ncbi:MAG TPA: RsmE family RNA methyltransferase [Gemmatimonadales bacterium]|nr:RsmE family RNA methyltransferase [Gemmatimonadales bacterium]